ncbi:hypothetical protein EDD21DRAFT_195770 [Dissophora ornata]|nr:hypothetical protein EDD21DRAFT_195770 [Dissophora ornata]
MSENPYLSLIANLNAESPVISSPEDYSAELSLWTNAEFTFDMPPGLEAKVSTAKVVGHNPQSAIDQQHLMEYLNLPQEDSRPLSLLERTRQRNPVNAGKPQSLPELQEQLPMLLPNIAPATAPTTPAAAKLLRQPMPQYKAASKKHQKAQTPAVIAPAATLVALAPRSPTTTNASAIAAAAASAAKSASAAAAVAFPEDKDDDAEPEKSAADSFSKDDPDYLQKVAAEEDKRRRNTAASARFRYKKKLREQALEQTAKEQTVRAETLEARVKELEMEVKWLRGLIVEKDSRLHEVSASLDDQANKRIKLDVY